MIPLPTGGHSIKLFVGFGFNPPLRAAFSANEAPSVLSGAYFFTLLSIYIHLSQRRKWPPKKRNKVNAKTVVMRNTDV